MSKAIKVRSFQESRAEVQRLKEQFVDATVKAGTLCYDVRDQASARGDEVTAWKVCEEALAIAAAYHAAVASLDRVLEYIEAAET
jgi:hypothetical protein